MDKNNRTCYTCGKEYRYCPNCAQYKHLPNWMSIVCSEECNDIFTACSQYHLGNCSKNEAKEILSRYDVLNKTFKSESVAKLVKEIFADEQEKKEIPKVKPRGKRAKAPVIDEMADIG